MNERDQAEFLLSLSGARLALPSWAREGGLGQELVEALAGRGCRDVRPLSEAEASAAGYRAAPLVVIGNLNDNDALRELYTRRLAFIDAWFPGEGGYFVAPVRAPSLWPHPLLLAGGSSQEGTVEAVRVLLEALRQPGTRLHRSRSRLLPAPPDPRHVDEIVERVITHKLTMGDGYGPSNSVIEWGFIYHLSGDPAWGALARAALLSLEDGYQNRMAYWKGPWEFFYLRPLVIIWRLLESDSLFSEGDRQAVRRLLKAWGDEGVRSSYAWPAANPPGEIRQNHSLNFATSILTAHDYLSPYVNLSGWQDALRQAGVILEGQTTSYRANDDAGNGGYAFDHVAQLLYWEMLRGEARFFTSGQAAKLADLAIITTDNRRDEVSYGDCTTYVPWAARRRGLRILYALSPAAWFYRNGAYQWAYEWLAANQDPGGSFSFDVPAERWDLSVGRYASDVEAAYPEAYCGVRALLLDEGALRSVDTWYADPGRAGQVPYAGPPPLPDDKPLPVDYGRWRPRPGLRYLDKMSFRPSFDPQDEYLCLQGSGTFAHGHHDANSIVRLTWKDRIWLADLDYIRAMPQHHNLVRVLRNGQGAAYPPLATLERLADWPGLGITRTRLRAYNGTDWTRTIIWRHGHGFAVLDDLAVEEAGDYQIECLWRTLGNVTLNGQRLDVEQAGVTFSIAGAPGEATESWLTRERRTKKSLFDAYPHAAPVVHVLHQMQKGSREPGQQGSFVNLLCAPAPGGPPAAAVRPLGQGLARVEMGDTVVVVGTPRGPVEVAGLTIVAEALYWTRERLALAGCKMLRTGNRHVLAGIPFNLDLDLRTGEGAVVIEVVGYGVSPFNTWGYQLTAAARQEYDRTRPVLRYVLHGEAADASILTNAYDALLNAARPARARRRADYQEKIASLQTLWHQRSRAHVTSGILAGEARVFGDVEGRVASYDGDGRRAWVLSLREPVRALLATALPGQPCIAVGTDAGKVHLLSDKGESRWAFTLPELWGFGAVQRVSALYHLPPAARAGRPLLLAGTEAMQVFALDADGALAWNERIKYHTVTALAAADVKGDGTPSPRGEGTRRIVVGNEYQSPINVLDGEGKLLWFAWEQVGSEARSTTVRSGTDVRAMRLADVNRDGVPEIIYGTGDALVIAMDLRNGAHVWKADVGSEVVGLEVIRTSAGENRIVVATDNGFVWLLGSRGEVLAYRALDRAAGALAVCDENRFAVSGLAGIWLLDGNLKPLARAEVAPMSHLLLAAPHSLVYAAGREVGEIGME
ncbi:MAG: PQQ-binding-like beta-propeller repeat protein [Anaerolineae bacterium]|nr:PQQ-binding-like beta-propeller repeat protein [Anaerolineae bacterium]